MQLNFVVYSSSKLKIENIKVDNLLTLNPCENESNLIVERDLITGKILDYHEVKYKIHIREGLFVSIKIICFRILLKLMKTRIWKTLIQSC